MISDSKLSDCSFFNLGTSYQVEIQKVKIQKCKFIKSIMLQLNEQSQLMNFYFTNNELLEESVGISNNNVAVKLHRYENVVFQLNAYDQDSSFIKIRESISPNKVLNIKKMKLIGNILLSKVSLSVLDQQVTTLLYLQIQNVNITDLLIERAYGIKDISFIDVQILVLNEVNISQQDEYRFKGLHQYVDCLTKSIKNVYFITSLNLYDVLQIFIYKLTIEGTESINFPIINVVSSTAVSASLKSIYLENANFTDNLLILSDKMRYTSIFQVSSEWEYQITILNSQMNQNLMHQYSQNDHIYSGLVLNFDCLFCTIKIANLLIQDNLVTNTSDPVISLKANFISFKKSRLIRNSIFNYSLIQPYLLWGFNQNEEIYVEQINEIFPIKVTTGNVKLIAQYIIIEDFIITNSSGSGLYIKLQSDSQLLINNSIFNHINSHFIDQNENGCALQIDSTYATRANIQIQNIQANDIHCRNFGGMIYFLNGDNQIEIYLINFIISDVYALQGSLMYSEFSSTSSSIQKLQISNIEIKNNLQNQISFLQKFNTLDSSLMLSLTFQRSLLKISNAWIITMQEFKISQLNFEQLAFLDNIKSIQIKQIWITQCQLMNSLIAINSNLRKTLIFINSLNSHNISIFDQIPITTYSQCIKSSFLMPEIQFQCLQGVLNQQSPIKLNSINNQEQSCIIQQLKQVKRSENASLITIITLNSSISISQISFQYLNCSYGLLYIKFLSQEGDLQMQKVNIQNNVCDKKSCVSVEKPNQQTRILESLNQYINKKQYELKIQDYICCYNNGYQGTCLSISYIKTLIVSSIFQHNQALKQGGSMIVIGNQSFILAYCTIQNNTAQYGGGFALADQISQELTRLGSVLNENNALEFANNRAQIPSSLSITTDLQAVLSKVKIIEQKDLLIEQIQIKPYQVFTSTYSDALYVPNGQILSKYQYFNWKIQEYIPYNLHLRIVALDQENSVQENLDDTYCEISGRLLKEDEITQFSKNFTSFSKIGFNSTDYNLDDMIFYLDDELNMTLQMQFNCSSIKIPIFGDYQEIIGYHSNYFLRLNIKTLPCQMGEIKRASDLSCQPCDAEQGQYSVSINSQNCTIKNDTTTNEIKSAQMNLRSGFWRPYFYTDQISQCINLLRNCLGGWKEGDTSCLKGHIGALCEECDIYNLRGEGHYSTSTKYSCSSCVEKESNSIIITAISIWTLISILISVLSTVQLIDDIALRVQLKKIRFFMSIQESYSGILIKMLTNHLQILSTIISFRLTLPSGLSSAIYATANPIQTMTYSLDCFLMEMFYFNIHYSRMIWQMIMPFIYSVIFFALYVFAIKFKKLKYSLNIITTTFIYLYIYIQPNLVGGFISLISFRNISNFKWIQSNVAYRYDTFAHYLWLLSFCLPGLLTIALLLPFVFFYVLYLNKENLNNRRVRQKWGYLYNEYKTDVYFWEIVKIVEKELLIIFLSYYDENIVKKGILVLLVLYVYQELDTKFKPYQSSNLNRLDAYSANVCEISVALGIGIYIDQLYGSLEIQIPYLIIVAILNLYFFLLLIKELLQSYSKLEILADKVRDLIRLKAPWTMNYRFLNKSLQNRQQIRLRVKKRYKKAKEYLMEQAKKILELKKCIDESKSIQSPKALPEFSEFSQRNQLQKELKLIVEEKVGQSDSHELLVR